MRKKTIFRCFVTLQVGLVGLVGCQGELKLNDGVGAAPMQMMSSYTLPSTLGFLDVYKDLDAGTGLGCTNQVSGCHGGTNPTGLMALQDMSAQDMTKLMANYTQVKARVDTAAPTNSKLISKPLDLGKGGTPHVGGNFYFPDTNHPTYLRWLCWVQLGASFDAMSTSTCPGGN